MIKILRSISLMLVICGICESAQLGEGEGWKTWKEYEGKDYTCSINNTGMASIRAGKGKKQFFNPFLVSVPGNAGSQWEVDKIEKIEGKEEDIDEGKKYTIKAKFVTGARFTEEITCSQDTVLIDYRVNAIPGKHEFYTLPIGQYKEGDLYWDCILSKTSLKYQLKDGETGDLKDIMKDGKRVIDIPKSKPAVELIEVGNYYGRKVKIEILSDGPTLLFYDRGGQNSTFALWVYPGTSENALSGSSVSYTFQYTITPLSKKEKLEEETINRITDWKQE